MNDNLKKILFFAYFFPPLGGPGIQRPCKMIHYLKEKGWVCDVISVKNILFHSYDKEMISECEARHIYHTNSADLMSLFKRVNKNNDNKIKKIYFNTPEKIKKIIRNIFPIDDKIGWLPFAYFQALQVSREYKFDTVMATIGPYTSGIVAYLISKKIGVPLVIDYRDPWTLHPYLKFPTVIHKQISEFWEKKILIGAIVVTTSSKTMKKDLISKYGNNLIDKIHVMYNGWDEEDFKNIKVKKKKDKIYFYYIGNLYGNQTVKYFVKALEELNDENYLPKDIEITFIGNYYIETIQALKNSKIIDMVKVIHQVSHRKAIEFMLKSDVLLLFISSSKGKGVVAGKIFEYLRAKKEILAMIPTDGETAEILRAYNHNFICAMEDVNGIKKNFLSLYENIKIGRIQERRVNNEFSRKHQTFMFEKFLSKRLNEKEIK